MLSEYVDLNCGQNLRV